MPCELELAGEVATFRVVINEPELEDRILDERSWLQAEVYDALSRGVGVRFQGKLEVAPGVRVDRGGSIVVLATLVTVGRVVIEFGALMTGLRELARLIPDWIRRAISTRMPARPRIRPAQVILGPAVLVGTAQKRRAQSSQAVVVALSAAGGAALIVAGVLLGHFL